MEPGTPRLSVVPVSRNASVSGSNPEGGSRIVAGQRPSVPDPPVSSGDSGSQCGSQDARRAGVVGRPGPSTAVCSSRLVRLRGQRHAQRGRRSYGATRASGVGQSTSSRQLRLLQYGPSSTRAVSTRMCCTEATETASGCSGSASLPERAVGIRGQGVQVCCPKDASTPAKAPSQWAAQGSVAKTGPGVERRVAGHGQPARQLRPGSAGKDVHVAAAGR